jgi:NAD-dependent SIR2 family protein deacetylase
MNAADFLRLYPLRAPHLHWFLGAGASAAAGIPTAFNMIWDFKRTLYCAAQGVSIRLCQDLNEPTLRFWLQHYFESKGTFPREDSIEEYAHYFEATYPTEADRRRYIDRFVSAAAPSIGHVALATLAAVDKARGIWTTNFDRLIEDAIISALGGSGRLTVSTLDSPRIALQAMNEGRWPVLGKLHGDFQSRRLKNTTDELRAQDSELRHALVEACRRFGMIMIGYSGRDRSVMDSLEEAIDEGRGYPAGLFWFHRTGSPCLPQVLELIGKAKVKGVDAHLVDGDSFDALLPDVTRMLPDLPDHLRQQLDRRAERASNAPIPRPGRGWPVVRTNALPVLEAPTVCRRVVCDIGGTKEVRAIVSQTGADILAGRTQFGVLAFGSDRQMRQAFGELNITEFGVHAIEPRRLRFESTEFGLLYDALTKALTRERPLLVERRGQAHLARVDASRPADPAFRALRGAIQDLSGTVPQTDLRWAEAVRLRLDFRLDRLWLLLEPTIWTERGDNEEVDSATKLFVQARLASRFNRPWNAILGAWIEVLLGGEEQAAIRAFGISDGIDAAFTIARTTAFSRPE